MAATAVATTGVRAAESSSEREVARARDYFMSRFPDVPLDRYGEGPALLDTSTERQRSGEPASRAEPDELNLYAECLPKNARAHFPGFDEKTSEIVTLREAINDCRTSNGKPRLEESDRALDRIEAVLAQQSDGQKLDISMPRTGTAAQDWFDKGRFLFNAKRGRQNLSCANCHEQYAGSRYEGSVISASLSHALRFPAYSESKDGLISLHEQYVICSEREGAKPYAVQSDEYKALEYYQSVIASGIPIAAPASVE